MGSVFSQNHVKFWDVIYIRLGAKDRFCSILLRDFKYPRRLEWRDQDKMPVLVMGRKCTWHEFSNLGDAVLRERELRFGKPLIKSESLSWMFSQYFQILLVFDIFYS